MFSSDEVLDRAFKLKEREWKDSPNHGATVTPVKATSKNQRMESARDPDEIHFPGPRGLADRLNELLPAL